MVAEGHRAKPHVEAPEDRADQQDLEHRRQDVEEQKDEQELDAADAALDDAREAAGLALQMEAQRQRDADGGRSSSATARTARCADLGEDRVAQLGEGLRAGRARGHRPMISATGTASDQRLARRQRIDRVLVEHRHIDGAGLGDDQQADRDHHAYAKLGTVARPEIGQQAWQTAFSSSLKPTSLTRSIRRRCPPRSLLMLNAFSPRAARQRP